MNSRVPTNVIRRSKNLLRVNGGPAVLSQTSEAGPGNRPSYPEVREDQTIMATPRHLKTIVKNGVAG